MRERKESVGCVDVGEEVEESVGCEPVSLWGRGRRVCSVRM